MQASVSLWPSSVCRHAPLLASQILTVLSQDADASRVKSCEKATELTELLWPSSVCRHALHPSLRAGLILIASGSSCWNSCLIRLPVRLKQECGCIGLKRVTFDCPFIVHDRSPCVLDKLSKSILVTHLLLSLAPRLCDSLWGKDIPRATW
jgi:hypothetical protein